MTFGCPVEPPLQDAFQYGPVLLGSDSSANAEESASECTVEYSPASVEFVTTSLGRIKFTNAENSRVGSRGERVAGTAPSCQTAKAATWKAGPFSSAMPTMSSLLTPRD